MVLQQYLPLAVLKHDWADAESKREELLVATVLTACGIETTEQYSSLYTSPPLQQYLPLAVLKHIGELGKEPNFDGCNSTYRLRY